MVTEKQIPAFAEDLVKSQKALTLAAQLAEWRQFYIEIFGKCELEAEDLNPRLPAEAFGIGRLLIVVIKGLTLNGVLQVMQSKMNVYSYIGGDLDAGITMNDRTAEMDYAILILDCIEADEENKNLSATKIIAKGIKGMTLLERLILELFFYWKRQTSGETNLDKMHLDVKNVTLCTGSRDSGGCVPSVGWGSEDRRVCIGWCDPDKARHDGLRTRAVQLVATAA